GPAGFGQLLYFLGYGIIFFAGCAVNEVLAVFALNGNIGWDFNDVEFVDLPKFTSLGDSRTGHPRQLVVHAEVILQGNGGVSLRSVLYLDVFFGFDGLVQAV